MEFGGILSYETLRRLEQKLDRNYSSASTNPLTCSDRQQFMDLPIRSSPAFPFIADCSVCEGTGEGTTSTYCEKCNGQGRNKYLGMIQQQRKTILVNEPLEKAFLPHWPKDISVPLREIQSKEPQ